eukprot:XP_011680823.1 PREDICTED: leucine-rich repeat and immunoglobulin-like domain-containing nogo receptor-interacting protein 3 [Strongylocentrotus purpuratus]
MFTPPMICDYDVEQKKADCSDRGLESIPQNLRNDIKLLDVARNNITFILNSTFKRYPLIQVLNLSSNDIRTIESASFYPLKELNHLILSSNANLVLPATGLFRRSKNLSILDLSFCNLKLLPNDILKWSPSVETINLMNNRLTFVNMSLCGRARNVFLNFNEIEYLTAESFIFGCQSDYVGLFANPIKLVDPNLIASLGVRSLVFGGYPLTLETLTGIFSRICHSGIVRLEVIDSNFTVLPRDFVNHFRNCSLTLLRLSGNEIQSLVPYVFSNLTRLVELDLSQNKIVTVEPIFFQGMRELKVLNLTQNELTCINPNIDEWLLRDWNRFWC